MADLWDDEDRYWRQNYASRPYATGSDYDTLSPGYRYGYESAQRYRDRAWDDVEGDLERDWNTYSYRGKSTWQQVKDAARDAWDRVTGRR
jgi:hypothetical protein